MALQPSLGPLLIAGTRDAPHTIETFMDYPCPLSAKLARTINSVLKPWFDKGGRYYGVVKLIVRPQAQPWYSFSAHTHEAALAVIRVSPEHFWAFSCKVWSEQKKFQNIAAGSYSPLQIYDKLVDIAASVIQDKDKVEEIRELLKFGDTIDGGGTGVWPDLKYTVKITRQNGVHFTPTVLWDGLIASEITASWGEVEWSRFFAEKVEVRNAISKL